MRHCTFHVRMAVEDIGKVLLKNVSIGWCQLIETVSKELNGNNTT